LPVVFDLQIEAEVLGCDLVWAAETPPAVTSHPLAGGKSVTALPPFSVDGGRFPLIFDAVKRLKADIGEDVALYGLITGPFTLAMHLMGNELFLKMRRDPAAVTEVVKFCAEVGEQAARGYLEAGCDIVAVVDPMTSQISPKHFAEFVEPHVNAVFNAVRAAGGLSSMFVCGDASRNLEAMCRTNCDNVSIDENVPLEMARELSHQHQRSFGGNLKLTAVLLLGDEDDSKLEALRCMEIGGTNGFVLAPGCDLPYATPPENLQAVALMVHDEYQRHVANTTLHAKVGRSFEDVAVPDYAGAHEVFLDVITLDSASCAPCTYMVGAAKEAAKRFGGKVRVQEHKISTHAGLGMMDKLGVENVPTLCVDGDARFVSLIPDEQELDGVIAAALEKKGVK
jgi:uroporphyrinogen decarboxylase